VGEFELWYSEAHPRVITALTVIAADVDLATDATDEAFARAYERWGRVSRMPSPSGWVYQTGLHVLRRTVRRANKERDLLAQRRADATAPPSDWSTDLWDGLRALPVRERTAMALRYVADLTGEQIADAMGVRVGTVWSMLDRGRSRLRDLLDPAPESEAHHG
jgi:RNA polymerase sigma-70 factor (ECF subfamily)